MVVFTGGSSDAYRELAEEIATDRNTRVVTDPEHVPASSSILYVDSPERLSESRISHFQSKVQTSTASEQQLGIITGRTIEEARSLYFSRSQSPDQHGLLIRGTDKSLSCTDEDATILTQDDATAGNLSDLQEDGLASLSMVAGLTDIHAYLEGSLICGVPKDLEKFDFDGYQPACMVDGELDCTRDGDFVRAEDLEIQHVFLSGCASLLPNKEMDLPVHLALALLSGAESMIGGYRVMGGFSYQACLHYDLLRAGYTAAERAYLLNMSAQSSSLEMQPYVVFGRPESRIDDALDQQFSVETQLEDGTCHIEVHDVDAPIIDFTVPTTVFASDQDVFYLRNVTEGVDRDLFYTAFREGDEVRVVVGSWGRIDATRLEFELAPNRLHEETNVAQSLQNVNSLKNTGLLSGKARGQIKNARNNFLGLNEYICREPFNANVHRDIRDRIEQIENSMANARQSWVEELDDRTGLIQTEYWDKMYQVDVTVDRGSCPYCGRDVFNQQLQDVFSQRRRTMGQCPRCDYIYDVPTAEPTLYYPELQGDLTLVQKGTSPTLRLSFENPFERRVDATYFPRVNMHRYSEKELFSPATADVELAPYERRTVEFDLATDPLDRNYNEGQHHLEGHVVVDTLQTYTGMRTLYLTK